MRARRFRRRPDRVGGEKLAVECFPSAIRWGRAPWTTAKALQAGHATAALRRRRTWESTAWMKEAAMTVPEPGAGTPTVTVAVYLDYASAQRAVDHLSDNGFPVA